MKLKIKHIDNKLINSIARYLGCPEDKKAGNKVKKGETILTLYAVSKEKLNHAKKFYNKNKKLVIGY